MTLAYLSVTVFLFLFVCPILHEVDQFPSIFKEDLGFARLVSVHTPRVHSFRRSTSTYGDEICTFTDLH